MSAHPVSEAFARRFHARAEPEGALAFSAFMDLALYDPDVGYYSKPRKRIGYGQDVDFYTSSTSDSAFGPLVAAAAEKLLGPERARQAVFVEIGAEPGETLLDHVRHPFAGLQTARLRDPLNIPPQAVVFSNELFDAQPFHRLQYHHGRWVELWVQLENEKLGWIERDIRSPEITDAGLQLPPHADEGHIIDLPLRAASLLRAIAAESWQGLFLAFDYGRTWPQLRDAFPRGTGRAYYRHHASSDLLSRPGDQDLTCHVCWDWLTRELAAGHFDPIRRESQESFFLHHAARAVEKLTAENPNPLSRIRSQVRQLLHPGLMGQRFEALWGLRT